MTTMNMIAASAMEAVDWVMVAGYFAIILGLAVWVIRKNRDTSDDYFLAGRHLSWFIVGASIFASNIGSEHLVGLAGSGCTDGVGMAHYELHAWCLLVLGWVFVPFYARSMVFTMPEFLERRFSATARWVLSLISLVAYVITKIAVGIFAGGIVFSVLLPEMQLTIGSWVLDSFWIGSVLVIVFTGLYTMLGGLRAVAYTEALQTVILVIGSALVTLFGIAALGGWAELKELCGSQFFDLWRPLVPEGVEATSAPVIERVNGEITRQAWYFKGASQYPWLGMLFCAPIIGLWYWCTDQYIVQRALGAPNEQQARRGSICAAFFKLLPVFIFIIPGMICFALILKSNTGHADMNFEHMLEHRTVAARKEFIEKYPAFVKTDGETGDRVLDLHKMQADAPRTYDRFLADAGTYRRTMVIEKYPAYVTDGRIDLEKMAREDPEKMKDLRKTVRGQIAEGGRAFPMMVMNVLPVGVRGIVVAGLLAALMSSLAGVFNASATLFTMDFYKKLNPNISEHNLVRIGRIATGAMIVIGLLWIPVIKGSRGLYDYLQSVQGYLAPPIFVVFFLGVFWKRLNSKGCLWALMVGFALGLFRLAVDTPIKMGWMEYAEGSFFWIVHNIYFQYYSLFIFLVCVGIMIMVSLATAPPSYEKISGLTYGTVTDEHRLASRGSWDKKDVLASVAVCALILAAYLYFTGA